MRHLTAKLWIVWVMMAGSAAAQSQRAIAILDLQARGVETDIVQSLTEMVAKEVDRVGPFRTVSMDDIRRMLQHEEKKMLMGCDDISCLAEIGGALGVDFLLAGGVGKIGKTYVVNLKLIDVRQVQVLKREERTVDRIEDLVDVSKQAARILLGPILTKETGILEIICNEEGAEVYVDDMMVGTTPLEPRKGPGGYHSIKVSKKRFVTYTREVSVEPGKITHLEVVLFPSRAYIQEYESKATTYRILAWTFSAITVVAASTATGLFVWNNQRLDDYNRDKEQNPNDLTLDDRRDSINTVDSATLGIAVVAVASLGSALYFWLAGDPPGKYEQPDNKKTQKAAWQFEGQLGATGIGASFTLRF